MCLVVFAFGVFPGAPLVVAANRDEYFARPATKAGWWRHEGVDIFGGRDLEKGGTWLGVTRPGRIAVVTNVRDVAAAREGELSRGFLTRDALVSPAFPPEIDRARFPSFNLLVSEGDALQYLRDDGAPTRVEPGLHGLSNHRLDTPWPKVTRALAAFGERTSDFGDLTNRLFAMLGDDSPASDEALPKTGVPLEVERALSSPFVRMPVVGYGTRCSTVVARHASGVVDFEERTFDASGALAGTVKERIFPL